MPSGTYKFIIQLSINGQGLGNIQSNSPLDFLVSSASTNPSSNTIVVSKYGIKPAKPTTVSVGGSATLYATLSFSQPATAVTGNLLVVDSKGKRYKQFPLSLGNVAAGTRAVYKNFKIPASMPSGTYRFIIQLSINGQGLGNIQSNSPLDFLVSSASTNPSSNTIVVSKYGIKPAKPTTVSVGG